MSEFERGGETHITARNCGSIVLAEIEAQEPKQKTDAKSYTCDECKAGLFLRRTKHARYHVPGYFAHKNTVSACTGGSPESTQHLMAKFWLKYFVGHYDICLQKCVGCGPYLGFVSKASDAVHLELAQKINGKGYIYDTVVARANKCLLIIEVLHTHKTQDEKMQAVKNNGQFMAEVKAETVLSLLEDLKAAKQNGTRVEIPNLLLEHIECGQCTIRKQKAKAEKAMQEAQAEFDRESVYDTWMIWSSTIYQNDEQSYDQYSLAYHDWVQHLALKRRRKLQKRGFEMAFAKKEINAKKPSCTFAFDRQNKVCCLCKQWFPRSRLIELSSDLWTHSEYRHMQSWYSDRDMRLPDFACGCEDCTIDCEACGDRFPLNHASRYGLCFPCNISSRT
jgi:hypothetical protein